MKREIRLEQQLQFAMPKFLKTVFVCGENDLWNK